MIHNTSLFFALVSRKKSEASLIVQYNIIIIIIVQYKMENGSGVGLIAEVEVNQGRY